MEPVTRRFFLKTTAAAAALGTAAARAQDSPDSDTPPAFSWPEGKRLAISLSFDDARPSQVDVAFPLLEECGEKATFYVCPDNLDKRADQWRALGKAGHELGNHTVIHPCSGNFTFARDKALEYMTLAEMEYQLVECNRRVKESCGVTPVTFAYPCGNTFVGRGEGVQSFVPLVARHFLAGRGYPSEWHNAPVYCDLAQLNGVSMDRLPFETILTLIERTAADGGWLVLAGHDAGDEDGRQITRVDTLRAICEYAQDPDNGVWLDTVAAIAGYVQDWKRENNLVGDVEHV